MGGNLSKAQVYGITFGTIAGVLVIVGVICAVIFTLPGPAAPVVTPTLTSIPIPTRTLLPLQNILLQNDSGSCWEFSKLATPNILNPVACSGSSYWVYDPNLFTVTFVAPTFQYCVINPTSTSANFPVVGGNSLCIGLRLTDSNTIYSSSANLCIVSNSGELQWGSCNQSYAFNVSPY